MLCDQLISVLERATPLYHISLVFYDLEQFERHYHQKNPVIFRRVCIYCNVAYHDIVTIPV